MKSNKRIVVFTGAGVSADSGISTFRDSDGLWASHRIEDVCTPEALARDRKSVLDFYDQRRKELLEKQPNAGHLAIAKLENYFQEVEVITQNIDDLHERAGSSHITHLHGELRKLRSSLDPDLIYPIDGWKQDPEARCAKGALLRPFVVFFGESVPMFEKAVSIVRSADILMIVGTSLAVYPAASLAHYAPDDVPIYLVDPGHPDTSGIRNKVTHIQKNGATGVPMLVDELIAQYAL